MPGLGSCMDLALKVPSCSPTNFWLVFAPVTAFYSLRTMQMETIFGFYSFASGISGDTITFAVPIFNLMMSFAFESSRVFSSIAIAIISLFCVRYIHKPILIIYLVAVAVVTSSLLLLLPMQRMLLLLMIMVVPSTVVTTTILTTTVTAISLHWAFSCSTIFFVKILVLLTKALFLLILPLPPLLFLFLALLLLPLPLIPPLLSLLLLLLSMLSQLLLGGGLFYIYCPFPFRLSCIDANNGRKRQEIFTRPAVGAFLSSFFQNVHRHLVELHTIKRPSNLFRGRIKPCERTYEHRNLVIGFY